MFVPFENIYINMYIYLILLMNALKTTQNKYKYIQSKYIFNRVKTEN